MILARLRDALQVGTQAQLAEFLDVRQGNVSQAIANNRVPDLWLYKVAYATGRSIEWLRTGEGVRSLDAAVAETEAEYKLSIPALRPLLTDWSALSEEERAILRSCIDLLRSGEGAVVKSVLEAIARRVAAHTK